MKSFTPSAWHAGTHDDAVKSIGSRVGTLLQRLLMVLLLAAGFEAQAQLIAWELNGQPGNQVSNNSTANAAGVGVGLLSRGAGLTPASAAGSISSSGWYASSAATTLAEAIANNDYYEFTVPLQSGYTASITSVFFNLQASNTGPGFVALRSSADNFAANLATDSINAGSTQPRTMVFNLAGITGTLTFRLYGYGNAAGTSPGTAGTLRIGSATGDDLAVFGTLTAPPCTLAITNISATPESCPGANDGGIAVTTTGGTGSLFFVINGPESDSNSIGTFTGLIPGNYVILVRDSTLCLAVDSTIVPAGQPSASISCPPNVQTGVDGASSCSWTSPAGGLPLNIISSCGAVDVSWQAWYPSSSTPSVTVAAWDFENAAKRVAPNLPYTADAGTAANINTAPISLVGGPAFSGWVNGTGGSGTFAPNSNTWNGAGDKYWMAVVNTAGYRNLALSSQQQSSNTGPRDFRIEYSLNGVNWIAVAGSDFTTVPATSFSGVLSNLALPADCDNRAALYLRWLRTSETAAGGGTVASAGTNRIDGVILTGQTLGAADAAGAGAVGGLVFPLGTSTVAYTASATGGSPLASCSFTVSVIDNVPPVVVCSNPTVTFNGQNNIPLNVNALAGASDNCGGLQSLTISPNAITCDKVGQVVPVTATARDSSGNTSTCTSLITVAGLPCGWSQNPNGVNCTGGNSVAFNATANLWTINSTNCYYDSPFTSDSHAFAQRTLCGDGSITAQVTNISGSAFGWAGVIMRESNAAGARKIQLTTNLSNFSQREVRTTTGGQAFPQQLLSYNRYWLRISRTGNQFTMYVSANGQAWFFAGAQIIQMAQCIQMGLVLTNYGSNSTVTATFANVSTTGSATPPPAPGGSLDVLSETEHPMHFSLFPNPSSGEVTLDLAQYAGKPVRMELYNLQGQLLYFREVDEVQNATERLDLSSYKAGMYIVKVRSEGLPEAARRVILSGN